MSFLLISIIVIIGRNERDLLRMNIVFQRCGIYIKKNLFFSNGTRQMRVPRDFRSNFKEANQAHGCIVAQPCIAPAPGALKDCFDYTSSRSIGRYTFNRNSLRIVSCHRNSITDFFFTRVIFFRPKPINFPLQFFLI